MVQDLASAIEHFADQNALQDGVFDTKLPGVSIVRRTKAGGEQYEIQRPLLCLVVQGAKEILVAGKARTVCAGTSWVINGDKPTVTRIVSASPDEPYLAFAMNLNPAIISEMVVSAGSHFSQSDKSTNFYKNENSTKGEVEDTARRMIHLHKHDGSISVLAPSLIQEMHHWLIMGEHGPNIRPLGFREGHRFRIQRAVDTVRAEFRSTLTVGKLAEIAGMSQSTFHHHFKEQTSLTPIQFQKQIRLIEARHIMATKGASVSEAAFNVGFESVSQFSRDYRRLFGLPPLRDVKGIRARAKLQPL